MDGFESNHSAEFNDESQERNRLSRYFHIGKRAVQSAIIAMELLPVNEAMRFGAFGAAEAAGWSPAAVASVYAGTTLLIEGVAGLAVSDLLDSDTGRKSVEKVNEKLVKIGIPEEAKTNTAVKAGIAFAGGTAVVTAVNFRENPELTKEENRRYSLKSAIGLSAVCGAQGYLVANGIANPNVSNIGFGLIAAGSIFGVASWIKRRGWRKTDAAEEV